MLFAQQIAGVPSKKFRAICSAIDKLDKVCLAFCQYRCTGIKLALKPALLMHMCWCSNGIFSILGLLKALAHHALILL